MSGNLKNLKFGSEVKRATTESMRIQVNEMIAGMSPEQRRRVEQCPPKYRLKYAKSLINETARALAVEMKCYECVGFEQVVDRIGNCNCRSCPLWLHRPLKAEFLERAAIGPEQDESEHETGFQD